MTIDEVITRLGKLADAPVGGEAIVVCAELRVLLDEVERLTRILPPGGNRAEGGVGEGSWAVFAQKAVAERDEARQAYMDLMDERNQLHAERDEARAERDQLQERLRGAYEAARVGCHREACSVPEEIEWRVALGSKVTP